MILLHAAFLAAFAYLPDSDFRLNILAGDYASPVVFVLFVTVSLALYLSLAFINPGYVPKMDPEAGMMLQDTDHCMLSFFARACSESL